MYVCSCYVTFFVFAEQVYFRVWRGAEGPYLEKVEMLCLQVSGKWWRRFRHVVRALGGVRPLVLPPAAPPLWRRGAAAEGGAAAGGRGVGGWIPLRRRPQATVLHGGLFSRSVLLPVLAAGGGVVERCRWAGLLAL